MSITCTSPWPGALLLKRFHEEERLLQRQYPSFHLQYPSHRTYCGLVGTLRAYDGNPFVFWLSLADYPLQAPDLYIIEPQPLYAANGLPLDPAAMGSCTYSAANSYGHVQLHYGQASQWSPATHLKTILRCGQVWIDGYKRHLRSARTIDREIDFTTFSDLDH